LEAVQNFAVFLVLSVLCFLVVRRLQWVANHTTPGGLLGGIAVACVLLFYVRRFFRLGYGALEFLLGLSIVADVVLGPTPDPTKLDEPLIKVAAGMYLAIRGIDNSLQWLDRKFPASTPQWIRLILRP
jgi:hypothetical protein